MRVFLRKKTALFRRIINTLHRMLIGECLPPFWRKEKKESPKIQLGDINLFEILIKAAPTIFKNDEIPCFGHAIDQIEPVLVDRMRPLIKEAYRKGLLHLFPLEIGSMDRIKVMTVTKLVDNNKFKVEKFAEPSIGLLFELKNEEYRENVSKQERVVDRFNIWNEISGIDPVFSDEGPLQLKESLRFTINTTYVESLLYRVMEFENEGKTIEYFDMTENLLRGTILFNVTEAAVKRNISMGLDTNEARKRVATEEKFLNQAVASLVNRSSVEGVEIIIHKTISEVVSLSNTFQYLVWWMHRNRVFSLITGGEREDYGVFKHLFKIFRLNQKHLEVS